MNECTLLSVTVSFAACTCIFIHSYKLMLQYNWHLCLLHYIHIELLVCCVFYSSLLPSVQKCNHPTSLSPTLIHTEDILQRSERTFLSGISIPQKATSDSSKLVMVVDEHQSSIDSTERAWQFAVFPDSLLPLVLQVLSLASGVEEERSMLSQRLDQREESISTARKLDHMVS